MVIESGEISRISSDVKVLYVLQNLLKDVTFAVFDGKYIGVISVFNQIVFSIFFQGFQINIKSSQLSFVATRYSKVFCINVFYSGSRYMRL